MIYRIFNFKVLLLAWALLLLIFEEKSKHCKKLSRQPTCDSPRLASTHSRLNVDHPQNTKQIEMKSVFQHHSLKYNFVGVGDKKRKHF